ncbi:MAG: dihydrolipoyl dehydrogenase [Syntrophobacter sp.]
MAIKVTVIGAGPGGYTAAIRAAQRGAEVTLIERDNVGGTCLNWGCIPSKIMITTAELLDKFNRAQEFGLKLEGKVGTDMQRLMERKEKVIKDQTKGILDLLQLHKVRYLRGTGIIKGKGLASAQLEDGTTHEITWDRLIIASGTEPFNLPGFPFDGEQVLSSSDALCLRAVPESLMILGGGVIGCEFAFLFASLGSRVSVVESMDRLLPLPSVDEACSRVIQREMKKRKISFQLRKTAQSVERAGGRLRVSIGDAPFAETGGKPPAVVEVDKLLVSIGRRPKTSGIGLDTLDVALDEKGWIIADEHMQTNAPGVYAIGDVLGPARIMLAHVASSEGLIAAENATGGNRIMDYGIVPGAIFTMPEVANVGLSEAQARDKGLQVRVDTVLFRTLGKAQVIGEIAGETKIISEVQTGRLLGVHIVGPHATDLIAEATLALKMGATVTDLAETIHAHPTLSEVMLEASFKALDISVHG